MGQIFQKKTKQGGGVEDMEFLVLLHICTPPGVGLQLETQLNANCITLTLNLGGGMKVQ